MENSLTQEEQAQSAIHHVESAHEEEEELSFEEIVSNEHRVNRE